MHVLPCERVREELPAYYDGELSLDEQVGIQNHLQECVACRLEAGSLQELGDVLRTAAASVASTLPTQRGQLTGPVLERIRIERQLSLTTQLRSLFDDMHLVWAGLGATFATVVCIVASAGVLQAANREHPESLAGIISHLANAGSNTNPVLLDGRMLAPRAMGETALPVTEEDAEVTLAAVVTREGTVQNVELLDNDGRPVQVKPAVMLALLDAASRARFVPAQAGGAPVAVNMVWMLSTTTVKGLPNYDLYLVSPPAAVRAVGPSLQSKPRPVAAAPAKSPATEDSPAPAAAAAD